MNTDKLKVIETRNEMYRLLALVPEKRCCDCTKEEQQKFTDLEVAIRQHESAVRANRYAK